MKWLEVLTGVEILLLMKMPPQNLVDIQPDDKKMIPALSLNACLYTTQQPSLKTVDPANLNPTHIFKTQD